MKNATHRSRTPRVIAAVSMQSNFGPSVLRGVFAHIAEHGEWGLEIIRSAQDFTSNSVLDGIRHKIDGILIALNEETPAAFRALAGSGIPFVTIETYSPLLESRENDTVHFRIDNRMIGRDAARSFTAQGCFASFGYVPHRRGDAWSRLRGEGFASECARRHAETDVFPTNTSDDPVTRRGNLAKWLRKLDKPAAVFAADDSTALEVLYACSSAHLVVPHDVSILGVDDEELICENSTPRLSSIRPDFVLAGRKAAEALERMMRSRKKPTHTQTVVVQGENELAQRESTLPGSSAGPLVQKALSFIKRNARYGICVKDVQNHLKVSRSLMDTRFREIRGSSVLSAILDARLRELKRLLRETSDPIESITLRLGWSSPNYPKNLFKRTFGLSMRDWRATERRTASS